MNRKHMLDAARTKAWNTAKAACGDLPPRRRALFFRWLMAEAFNAFDPQPCQEHTKTRIRERADVVMRGMADVGIMEPAPVDLAHDPAWSRAIAAGAKLETDQRRSLMRVLAAQDLPPEDAAVQASQVMLMVLLHDMERQHTANVQGWDQKAEEARP